MHPDCHFDTEGLCIKTTGKGPTLWFDWFRARPLAYILFCVFSARHISESDIFSLCCGAIGLCSGKVVAASVLRPTNIAIPKASPRWNRTRRLIKKMTMRLPALRSPKVPCRRNSPTKRGHMSDVFYQARSSGSRSSGSQGLTNGLRRTKACPVCHPRPWERTRISLPLSCEHSRQEGRSGSPKGRLWTERRRRREGKVVGEDECKIECYSPASE
jgi:hypothetical protein